MKYYLIILMLFFCTAGKAADLYVAKTGNDSNDGSSWQEAKLTIGAMVTASSNSDTIYIGTGDYDETVDLDTANKSITLDGVDKTASIARTGGSEKGIALEDDTTIKNLTISTTSKTANSIGIWGDTKNNLVIENCNIFGAYDGVRLDDCSEISIKNCSIASNWDGFNLTQSTLATIDNCQISTDGTYSATQSGSGTTIYGNTTGTDTVTFTNCSFETSKTATVECWISGIYIQGNVKISISNCSLKATLNSTIGTTACGIKTNDADIIAIVSNCNITTAVTDAGTAYDLYNSAGTIYTDNSSYDRTKTSGKIIEASRTRRRYDLPYSLGRNRY